MVHQVGRSLIPVSTFYYASQSTANHGADRSGQELFEKIYTFYSVAQAGLAYLQRHPMLANAVYKIQNVLLPVDIAFLGATYFYSYKRLRETIYSEPKQHSHSSLKFNVIAAITGIAILALPVVAMARYHDHFKSTIPLNEFIKQLPLSQEFISSIKVNWTPPLIHLLKQGIAISRIASLIALSYFSKQKQWNFISMACQGYNLFGLSRLCWIQIDQELSMPLKNFEKNGATFTRKVEAVLDPMQGLKLSSNFLVDRSYWATFLKSTLPAIERLFDKSAWNLYCFSFETYKDGLRVRDRWDNYAVNLQPPSIDQFGHSLLTYLYSLSLSSLYSVRARVISLEKGVPSSHVPSSHETYIEYFFCGKGPWGSPYKSRPHWLSHIPMF